MTKKKRTRSSRKKKTRWFFPLLLKLMIPLLLVAGAWVFYLDVQVRSKFSGDKWAIPARVYGQPLELYEGAAIELSTLKRELQALGYQGVKKVSKPGQMRVQGNRIELYTKGFHFWDQQDAAARYQLWIDKGRLVSLTGPEPILRLEPQEIGSIYPRHGEDRVLVTLDDIPPLLGETLIAVEDNDFAHHYGISFRGILRAMWANVRAQGFVQGGSTITQQLVKNFYLTHERSLRRKIQEVIMAVLLELHYSKAEILSAYLNEVYLGQSGPRAIHGFGLAAKHYFNRPVSSLNTEQVALLIGVVKGASYYNPWHRPERSLKRRNLVLDVMAEHQLISDAQLQKAKSRPLGVVTSNQRTLGEYPAFLDLVKRQLLKEYKEEDLQSKGLRIFTTMSPHTQRLTEQAVAQRLKGFNKNAKHKLQSAAIVTAVGSGEILALVGDSNPRFSGFNRALDAHRQVGSLVKPFVFQTALMRPKDYSLMSLISDQPFSIRLDNGDQWQPSNFDGSSREQVTISEALAHSYNQATVALGMKLGVPAVIKTLEKAGLQKDVQALPSLLLGAVNLSPLDVSSLYHTLAADGVYTDLRAIRSVLNGDNEPLQRYSLRSETRFNETSSHLMHYALQTVMTSGTGRRAYNTLPSSLVVAGKTGTTNNNRDSWFAGYSGDHLGVVWVGNDDNLPTGLTGSTGALSVWADIFKGLKTTSLSQNTPEGIEYYWVDNQNSLLTAEGCKNAQLVPFVAGSQPEGIADCARTKTGVPKWLKKIFQ